jgi:5'-nucleotidase
VAGRPIEIKILQINDVYEIGPWQTGVGVGGLPRVHKYLEALRCRHEHVLFVHAGDMLSPSVYNPVHLRGGEVQGRHMLDVVHAMGLDMATLGNHEFDLQLELLLERIGQSRFPWLGANLTNGGQPLAGTKSYVIREFQGLRIAFLGLSVGSTRSQDVKTVCPIQTAKALVEKLRGSVDLFVAVTHLQKIQDQELLKSVPEIAFVIGGHEHEGMEFSVQGRSCCKAKSNARSMFVHTITAEKKSGRFSINVNHEHVELPVSALPHAETAKAVRLWESELWSALEEQGFKPDRILGHINEPYDGQDGSVRLQATNLGTLVAKAMFMGFENQMFETGRSLDLAVISGGALRLDDVWMPGPITEYDALRLMPIKNTVMAVPLKGAAVMEILQRKLPFTRMSYIQRYGNTENIDPQQLYMVAMTAHLQRRMTEWIQGPCVKGQDLRPLIMRQIQRDFA